MQSKNAVPSDRVLPVAVFLQLIGTLCGFMHGVVAVALQYQQGGGPDVAIGSARCRKKSRR
jgi:hypothetical protein